MSKNRNSVDSDCISYSLSKEDQIPASPNAKKQIMKTGPSGLGSIGSSMKVHQFSPHEATTP
jgi:hypothetical protein